jgi:type IV pilus assembly protein PilC
MLFRSRLSLPTLIEFCRSVRHYTGAGLTIVDVFRQQAQNGPRAVRPVAARIVAWLQAGDTLQEALKRESYAFPPLLLSLAGVAEQTGMVPEVFGELERHFEQQLQLRRQFVSQAVWPVVQFVLATVVLAGLIMILDFLPKGDIPGGGRWDPLGLGLFGPEGALKFLGYIYGTILALVVLYFIVTRLLRQRATVHRLLLRVPGIGPCMRALALGRFCVALRLTSETGMPIANAMRLALKGTGNEAFAAKIPVVEAAIRDGDSLTLALGKTGLFPDAFMRVLEVAEESGRLTHVMRHEAEQYHEEAARRLKVLTSIASFGVWLFVGVFIVFAIFRIFTTYISLYDKVGGI